MEIRGSEQAVSECPVRCVLFVDLGHIKLEELHKCGPSDEEMMAKSEIYLSPRHVEKEETGQL